MKHLPTGKNKEQFEEWYYLNDLEMMDLKSFYSLDFKMQSGVLTDYYDSLNIFIEIKRGVLLNTWNFSLFSDMKRISSKNCFTKSRNEALAEAFEQANNLINKNVSD